jgi:hypothetical protein
MLAVMAMIVPTVRTAEIKCIVVSSEGARRIVLQ